MTGTKQVRITKPLADAESEWVDQVRSTPSLALFLDFDGTLSPIVESPSLAKIDPEIKNLLERLVEQSGVSVTIVSGRALDDVRERAGVKGVIYAGNHGLEIESDTICFREPNAENLRLELRHLLMQLELSVSDTQGTEIEHKGLSASVHYRRVNPELHDWLRNTVCDTVSKSRSFVCRDGKMVVEVRPRIDWHKGHAVCWILDSVLPGSHSSSLLGRRRNGRGRVRSHSQRNRRARRRTVKHLRILLGARPRRLFVNFLSTLLKLRPNAEKGH